MDNKVLGNIASIETTGFVDGPGIRVIVFMQGCPLRCLYCHNPDIAFFNDEKKLMTPQQILNKLIRYKSYFGNEGGVTFSGGEPLKQPEFLLETLKLCKENNINTALDTSGVGNGDYDELLNYVDTVILDIKAVNPEDYKKLTGLEIDRFNKFLQSVQKKKVDLWLRQVIVPNINDTEENILNLKKFISKLKNVKKVELLPYHDLAKSKYEKLGIDYRLKDTKPMDKTRCNQLQKLLLSKDNVTSLQPKTEKSKTINKAKSNKSSSKKCTTHFC